jgi:hypothetical protein
MNKDYLYCINDNTCIHRRGCKRWIGNYTDEEAIEESNNNVNGYVDDYDCMRVDDEHCFDMLDRFRSSIGEFK